jgi:twitching motility protein PilT
MGRNNEMSFEKMLQFWADHEASDLHIKAPNPPFWRIHGRLEPMPGFLPMTEEQVRDFTFHLIGEEALRNFQLNNELDCAKTLSNGRRIRINVHTQQGLTGLSLRLLPVQFFPLSDLGLPLQVCEDICSLKQGLVLVTGATGSGKSTTLASFVNAINERRSGHIVTIEDPIEYQHQTKKCLITQREVGRDTANFGEALRRVLREDPDIVLIGEMRDLETIRAALTISETGHLTFGTLHTSTAVHTITRIISAFPTNEQELVRTQLSGSLRHVICQRLLPTAKRAGRCLAAEIMIATPAVQSLIRENRVHQISSAMQTGSHLGMTTLDQSINKLLLEGKITAKTAEENSLKEY